MNTDIKQIKEFLDYKADFYNNKWFIEEDPISVPHRFTAKNDIEIAAFFTALISWGKRASIIQSANKLMGFIDDSPYEFVMNHNATDLHKLEPWVYRTFNSRDLCEMIAALKTIYSRSQSLELFFENKSIFEGLNSLRNSILIQPHSKHLEKHISKVSDGAAAKRLNMFLRWMVRSDNKGVDFGIWKNISPASLMIPLDVHTGRVARSLGLLQRKSDDWKAVEEITSLLRQFDPNDPVKYDFALFGLGIYEGFTKFDT